MTEMNRMKRRQLYAGWIKWTVLPFLFFSALYFDGWINIQKQLRDYKVERLYKETSALKTQLSSLTSRLAQLRNMDRLIAEAEKIGLTNPKAHQYHTVAYREIRKRIPLMQMNVFKTAQAAPVITAVELKKTSNLDSETPLSPVIVPPPVTPESLQGDPASPPTFEHYEIPVVLNKPDTVTEPLPDLSVTPSEDPELSAVGLEEMLASL